MAGFDMGQVRSVHRHFQANLARELQHATDPEQVSLLARRYIATSRDVTSWTGNLVRRTSARVVRTSRGRLLKLRNTAKYARAQDGGSGLFGPKRSKYVIMPRGGKALSFRGKGGKEVTVSRVLHPGVRPTRFLFNAADGVGRAIRPWLETALQNAARRF